jgi:hypothetical protein
MKDLKKIKGTTAELTRLQSNLDNWATGIQKTGIANGTLLTGVELSSGANNVAHGLGREPLGYIIVQKNANVNVWDSQATNIFPAKFLALNAASDVAVNVWVF